MKVVVDVERCQGHAQCEFTAPEVFRLNDEARVEVLTENPSEELRGKVGSAVIRCPAEAIRILG
jgi:ferredoxin